jgi:hypothetical protein
LTVGDTPAVSGVGMPRIDPTAHEALNRLQREEERQAMQWLPRANTARRRRDAGARTAELLGEAKRLIEAIEKLL